MAASFLRKLVFALVLLPSAIGGRVAAASSAAVLAARPTRIPALTGPVSTLPALKVPGKAAPTPQPLATPQFRRYGVDDGVLRGQVYAVAQDRRGLLWFGSAAGLMRYDGVGFQTFRHVADDPRSLPANQTYALYVDRQNRVWAGGISTGLIVYDQRTERFEQWTHDDAKPASLADNEVWGMAQTADGELWVATGQGLDRMRKDGRGFDHVALDIDGQHVASFGTTRALLAEPDGRLWIGTENGLYRRDADGTLHRVRIDPAFRGQVGKVWRIEGGLGAQREVRVAVNGGLLIIGADGVARPFAPDSLSSLRVMSSTRDTHGRLWIATVNGLFLDEGGGRLRSIHGQPLLPGGLPGNRIWQTMLDREGGLWITFEQSSMAYLPPSWNAFTRFTHIPDDPASLTGIVASSIEMARDGLLWVGGNDGWIDKLDVGTGQAMHIVKNMRTQILEMAEDLRGRLWIDSPGELHVFDHGTLRAIPAGNAPMTRPVHVTSGDDGRIYVASWNEGVVEVDPDTFAITPLPHETSAAGTSDDTLVPEQIGLRAGSLWYACAGGLMRWDAAVHKLVFVRGVPRRHVSIFAFDASGFWILAESTIEHYRYANDEARRDDSMDIRRESFAADIRDLQIDRLGRLWVFANPGLFRFDPRTRRFSSFGPSQGLSNADFDSTNNAVAGDGTIFAVNGAGVLMFQPEQFTSADSAMPPPLTLTRVSVRREGDDVHLPRDGGTVSLGWRDRDLRVDARVASFINPKGNRYRFRLSGFDTDWVDVDSRGERDFAGLPAGSYTLTVQGAGDNSAWSSLSAPLRISVQAPPWARWWAWLAYALALLVIAGLLLRGWRRRLAQRHRMQMIEQQRRLAEAASAAKTQFLATLSHEIRTPMTGVMGMAELLLTTPLSPLQHDYAKAMRRSGGMLLKLLNDTLDLARIEAGRFELEPAPFDPRQLVEDIVQLEQGLVRMKGIDLVWEIADDLPARLIGDAVRIKQVLLNLVNNALKFTERGSVALRAHRAAGDLMFSVSDTGPGIPEASGVRLFRRFEQVQGPHRGVGSGLGLAICRELVEMMSGSIELESRLDHGSTFRVRLPLPEPAPTPPSLATTDAARRHYHLLLVEDDTIVAAVIGGLLAQQGHTVFHVANGLAALAELAHASFDAVLLDLDLPGVDGFQIARLIRQREYEGRRTPIVAVTARSGSEDEMGARAAGMDGFLRKPLSGDQLAEALAAVVAGATVTSDAR